jgi:hypothetical protein
MRYSTFDRELLTAFSAIKHFRFFLEGRPFTLFTDHKPLVSAISKAKTLFFLANCPFSQSSPPHLSTFLAIKMWWLTHFHGHLSQPRQKHPQQPLSHQPSPRKCFLYRFPTLTLPKQSKHASSSLHYKVCHLSTSRPFRFRHNFRFWVTCPQKHFPSHSLHWPSRHQRHTLSHFCTFFLGPHGQRHHRVDTSMHCLPKSQNSHSRFTSTICHSHS